MAIDTAYYNELLSIQDNNALTVVHMLDANRVYKVDLDTRIIEQPADINIIATDHVSETIYFKVPRYHDNMDLSQSVCIITYINADKKPFNYAVPYYDIDTYATYTELDPEDETATECPMILIPWIISNQVAAKAGKVTFALQFYMVEENSRHFIYNLNTLPQTLTIQKDIGVTKTNVTEDTLVNQETLDFESFLANVKKSTHELTWGIINSNS